MKLLRALPPTVTLALVAAVLAVGATPGRVTAHAPSVVEAGNESPATALLLDDPGLSRAIGATLGEPGEVDWYRMELRAGEAIVVEVTAPDAAGGIATSFTLVGPGLPPPASATAAALAAAVSASGAIAHTPTGGEREVHGGLGFIAWGGIRSTAPADGTYWIAVRAAEEGATGKYVLAPGDREEFGLETIGGMADLIAFFNAPWPPEAGGAPATAGGASTTAGDASATVATGGGPPPALAVVGGLGAALLLLVGASLAIRRRRRERSTGA